MRKMRVKAEMGLRHVMYYIEKNQDLLKNRYHNIDFIEPFAKKKDDVVYFWLYSYFNQINFVLFNLI